MSGELFGDFLQQVPVALLLLACAPGFLLIIYIAFAIARRADRGRKADKAAANTVSPSPAPMLDLNSLATTPSPSGQTASRFDTGELPDLDLLVPPPAEEDMPEETDTPPPDLSVEPVATFVPPEPEPPPARKAAEGVYTVTLHTGDTTEARELITILRDEDDGRLMVQMGEQAYRTLTDAPDAKKQFVKIMKELSAVVAKPDSRQTKPKPAAETTTPAEETSPTAEPEPSAAQPEPQQVDEAPQPSLDDLIPEPEPELELPNTPPPPPAADGSMPGDLPSFRLDDNETEVKRGGLFGRRQKAEQKPVPELDIGGAIDAYLQHKLRYTQDYDGPPLQVHSTPAGGVRIQVGMEYYDAVDEIDDIQARAFMKATIKEWQERH